MIRRLFLPFFLVPLFEIFLLIQVGGALGAWATIALVVATAMLGAFLVRAQGLATLFRARKQLAQGRAPAMEMLEGLVLFAAGALLLTPGFFTDALGFAFLVPRLRRAGIQYVVARGVFVQGGRGQGRPGRVLEGEFERVDE